MEHLLSFSPQKNQSADLCLNADYFDYNSRFRKWNEPNYFISLSI